jgi:hypothetical protein
VAQGASLVSLNPIRDTLEDLFVKRVADADTDRGLANSEPMKPEARSPEARAR